MKTNRTERRAFFFSFLVALLLAVTTTTHAQQPLRVIRQQVFDFGTGADTTEDALHQFSLPANTLNPTNACVYIFVAGVTGANTDSKDIRLYFGSTVIASALAQTANAKSWFASAYVCRTGANAQSAFGTAQVDTSPTAPAVTSPAENETGNIVVKVTGKDNTAANAGAVVQKLLIIQAAQ
jgi:hypothetical protein